MKDFSNIRMRYTSLKVAQIEYIVYYNSGYYYLMTGKIWLKAQWAQASGKGAPGGRRARGPSRRMVEARKDEAPNHAERGSRARVTPRGSTRGARRLLAPEDHASSSRPQRQSLSRGGSESSEGLGPMRGMARGLLAYPLSEESPRRGSSMPPRPLTHAERHSMLEPPYHKCRRLGAA